MPGGKAEEGDKDDGDTATREAKEEIGLDPSLVNVVTSLEPFLSKVLYHYHLLFFCFCWYAPIMLYLFIFQKPVLKFFSIGSCRFGKSIRK